VPHSFLSICSPDTPYILNKDILFDHLPDFLLLLLLFLLINDDRLYSLSLSSLNNEYLYSRFSSIYLQPHSLSLYLFRFYCVNKQNERIVLYVMFMGLCLSIENTSRELTASSYHSFSERLRTKSSVSN
jgi:hypothetical protein